MRNRRLSEDYERMVQSSETFIEVAMIRLILRWLARRLWTLPVRLKSRVNYYLVSGGVHTLRRDILVYIV